MLRRIHLYLLLFGNFNIEAEHSDGRNERPFGIHVSSVAHDVGVIRFPLVIFKVVQLLDGRLQFIRGYAYPSARFDVRVHDKLLHKVELVLEHANVWVL